MGTRHLICVQKDNEYKIAQYGQWDGYPGGQGVGVLNFLKDSTCVNALKHNLDKCRFYDEESDKEFLDSYNKNAPQWSSDPDNRTHEQKRWFQRYISRDIGSDILLNVAESTDDEILLRDEITFVADSVFCEYCYVVDFDKNTFEVFEGFNKDEIKEGRFTSEKFFVKEEHRSDQYHPVKFVKGYDLDNLPDTEKFLSDFEIED